MRKTEPPTSERELEHHAYVFFHSGTPVRTNLWPEHTLSWLMQTLTLSRLTHCAFAMDGVVVHVTYYGVRYYAIQDYIDVFPNIHSIHRIALNHGVSLDVFEDGVGVKQRAWPTAKRFFLRGLAPFTQDCLCTTMVCLMAGGMDVDPATYTLRGLMRQITRSERTDAQVFNRWRSNPTAFRVSAHKLCAGGHARQYAGVQGRVRSRRSCDGARKASNS